MNQDYQRERNRRTRYGLRLRAGDEIIIEGFHALIPNPDRRWWQFWKPRWIPDGPQQFLLVSVHGNTSELTYVE